jgi:transposase-like protein
MKREGREVWAERVRRLVESGLTAKEFAAQLNVNASTLSGWKWKLREGGELSTGVIKPRSSPRFVELVAAQVQGDVASSVQAGAEPFELLLGNGLRVRVPARFDVQALRALVSALEVR